MKYSLINSGFDTSWLSDFFNSNENSLKDRVCSFNAGTDIEETKDGCIIRLAAPGMTKEDLKINIDGRSVRITGNKKISETMTSKINREFATKIKVDLAKSNASIKNGILEIQLKEEKSEQRKKTIEIT
jgi:HSP20 family protein